MYGCGGNSAVQPHSMGGVMGGTRDTHTQEHTQERTRKCCTYPLATYPLRSARFQAPIKVAQPFPAPELRANFFYGHEDFSDPNTRGGGSGLLVVLWIDVRNSEDIKEGMRVMVNQKACHFRSHSLTSLFP